MSNLDFSLVSTAWFVCVISSYEERRSDEVSTKEDVISFIASERMSQNPPVPPHIQRY